MSNGYITFELDLMKAVLPSLIERFESMTPAALAFDHQAGIAVTDPLTSIDQNAQGVYQLLLNDTLVYIGKTDAGAGLRKRLERHRVKIKHRPALNPAHVFFKAMRVYVFTVLDLETELIKAYRNPDPSIQQYINRPVNLWNNSGFGSNDPGGERDTGEPGAFDKQYPIDTDLILTDLILSSGTAATVLNSLKKILPYTLRIKDKDSDLTSTSVTLPSTLSLTTANIISTVLQQLPPGWQATQLPGYILLNKESKEYKYKKRVWVSPGSN